MCGIAGCLTKKSIKNDVINKILDSMHNRGPDNQDKIRFELQKKNLYLFHSRLSIIDLEPRSHQPFKFRNYTLVFNGEIYNFKDIRNELVNLGYNFKTKSDTEVVIKAFSEWKINCFKKFIGMWSIAIWDDKIKKLYLSRDRFGEKPFYYIRHEEEFYFASELKTLKIIYNKQLELNSKKLEIFFLKVISLSKRMMRLSLKI